MPMNLEYVLISYGLWVLAVDLHPFDQTETQSVSTIFENSKDQRQK